MELPLLIEEWPQIYRELYEERAAIVEFESRDVTREVAELESERMVRAQARRGSDAE